jgi:hypothetical protein
MSLALDRDIRRDSRSLQSALRAQGVNSETWTDSDGSGMLHAFEEMIAYVSRGETLRARPFFGSKPLEVAAARSSSCLEGSSHAPHDLLSVAAEPDSNPNCEGSVW